MFAQLESLTKLAEHGIIAAAFLYLLYWLLNKQSHQMEEQAKYARLTNLEVARSIRSLVSAVLGMQQQLMEHDLSMSGLNPTNDASFEERDSLALKRYNDVMATLEEQRNLLHQMNQEADRRMNQLRKSD